MKKQLKRKLVACGLVMGACMTCPTMAGVPDSVYLFTYNADPGNGLNMAWSAGGKEWKAIGPDYAFVKSDFGTWGAQKRMFTPSMIQSPDGIWRLVFAVNNNINQFAVAESADLIHWRPQDYPYMEGVSSCLAPVLSYTNGVYEVVFKTRENTYYKTTSEDFFHFSKPQQVSEQAYRVKAVQQQVNGRMQTGDMFKVSYPEVRALVEKTETAAYWAALNGELARDNETRFAGLRPLEAVVRIDATQRKPISDKLIGIFFEDINYAADGGLYAELVQNRDFEYSQADVKGGNSAWKADFAWTLEGNGGKWSISTDQPIHENNPNYAVLEVNEPGKVALVNGGFDGIVVRKGEKYDVSLFAKRLSGKSGKLTISLVQNGQVVASTKVSAPGKEWKKVQAVLKPTSDADHASLRVEPTAVGTVGLDMISLFPQNTFKGRKNGMRADLAQALADMKPKFMRFPGGCAAHGDGIHNMYNWKETIGPLEARKPQRNIWGYHQTKGLGYYEYFQLCEDMGCEPLPVLAAGVPCQNSSDQGHGQQGGIPMDQMPQYIQDVLDLIEWANGDAKTTKWGRIRAEQGHPKPFNLKYLGIGNEDLISQVFEERYLMIIKAVEEKYPEIEVCGTVGPWCEGSDYEWGWKIANENRIDMVDEHYYQSPGWFIYHNDYYDNYDRNGSKVYLGEYAAHGPGRASTIETALCEALHICGMERNGDIVEMSSYAPLLAKEHHTQWNPDLIYFNNTEVKPTVGYYVQKLCGNSSGNEYWESTLQVNERRKGVRERLAVSTVCDSNTGKVYIKLVNVLNHPVKAKLDLTSLKDKFAASATLKARLQLLTGAYDDRNARPTEHELMLTPEMEYEMPAYSFSLIEL